MVTQRNLTILSWGLLFILRGGNIVDGSLANYTTPCSAKDKALDECLIRAATNITSKLEVGIPELGIPVGDPFTIPEASIYEPYTGINLTLINTEVRGLSGIHFTDASAEPEKYKMHFVHVIPRQTFSSDYIIRGRFMFMPIFDTGKSNVTFINTKFSWDIRGKPEIRDGVTYMRVTGLDVAVEPSFVNVQLSNLFNGNELLATALTTAMKVYWRDMFNFVKPELESLYRRSLLHIIDHIFSITPYNEIFSDLTP